MFISNLSLHDSSDLAYENFEHKFIRKMRNLNFINSTRSLLSKKISLMYKLCLIENVIWNLENKHLKLKRFQFHYTTTLTILTSRTCRQLESRFEKFNSTKLIPTEKLWKTSSSHIFLSSCVIRWESEKYSLVKEN